MTGEVAIGGVYLPALLVLATIALFLAAILSVLLNAWSAYRLVANRPVVDICLFILILGLLSLLTGPSGPFS